MKTKEQERLKEIGNLTEKEIKLREHAFKLGAKSERDKILKIINKLDFDKIDNDNDYESYSFQEAVQNEIRYKLNEGEQKQ